MTEPEPSFVGDAHHIVALYLRFVRRHRALLIGLPLLIGALAAGATLLKPRTYVGSLTVAVSKSNENGDVTVSGAGFVPYVQNNGILDQVIREFKLDAPPYNLSRTALLRDHYEVEPIRSTNLVVLKLRLGDPQMIARVLNRVASLAVDLMRNTTTSLVGQMQESLRTQLQQAESQMRAADTALRNFKTASQIELLRKDVDSILDQRGRLLGLSVAISEERSKLAKSQAELQARKPIQELRRTIDEEPALSEAARQRQGGAGTGLVGLAMRSEFADPVYQQVDEDAAASAAKLAALEEQRRQLVDMRHLNAEQLPMLNKLYAVEGELANLELRQKLTQTLYTQIANQYELSRLRAVDRGAQMAVVDPALPPDRPEGRGTTMNALMGVGVGLVLAVAILILRRPDSARV